MGRNPAMVYSVSSNISYNGGLTLLLKGVSPKQLAIIGTSQYT